MAITYPLNLPTSIGMSSISLRGVNVDALSTSPGSLVQQVVSHPGKRWEASVSIPPCRREFAEPWVGFLLSLNGRVGTFLLSDPNCLAPQGSAATTPGSPIVNGASQTGAVLNVSGLPLSATGYLKVGDYIQVGSGSGSKLHKVLVQVDSDGSGNASIDIWPALRASPADGSTVVVAETKGLFRLANPVSEWGINNVSQYGLSFDCVEAL